MVVNTGDVLAANLAFYSAFEARDLDAMQFIVADELVRVCGNVAWVACTENLLADDGFGGTVAALNVFEQQDDRWVIVAHHGSPVARKA